jgi:mannuronan synthase
VIKAFMSGEVVTSGNILNVAGRNNFTKPRTHANVNAAAPSLRRQLPGLLVVAAIGCLITTFIVGNLYNSLFIVRSEDAAVAGPVVSLKAPDAGVYRSRLDQGVTLAQKGQVIGTITPGNGGAAVAVQSPCNCYIASSVDNGEAVTEGQQVVSMTPIESKPWILAEVDPAQAKKIGPETVATATVFGSEIEYTGKVISMESALSNPARAGNRSVLMKIALDQKLPVNFVNRLAAVTFAIH